MDETLQNRALRTLNCRQQEEDIPMTRSAEKTHSGHHAQDPARQKADFSPDRTSAENTMTSKGPGTGEDSWPLQILLPKRGARRGLFPKALSLNILKNKEKFLSHAGMPLVWKRKTGPPF